MKLRDTMICWNGRECAFGEPLAVKVGPVSGDARWSDRFDNSNGACFGDWQEISDQERLSRLLALFVFITITDRVPAETVHQAFLEIDEYRETLPPDVPGVSAYQDRD